MIYTGHFTFFKDATNPPPFSQSDECHGHFTAVTEAESYEQALERFRALIARLHSEEDFLDGMTDIFLDACVECRSIPEAGFLTYYQERYGTMRGSISTSVVGADEHQAVECSGAFKDDEEDDESSCPPFVSLR